MNDPQHTLFSTSRSEYLSKQFFHSFKGEFAYLLQEITHAAPKKVAHTTLLSYTTLLFNRILVLFFLQNQGLLAYDERYLYHHLEMMRTNAGADRFYRQWLLPLFALLYTGHTAHMQPTRHFSQVPHLALPLFRPHDLEVTTLHLVIPDHAFIRLFAFLERFNWSLDTAGEQIEERQTTHILAYLFEQSSNQKQTGTYYTQEDVTRYITSHTIVPALLTRVGAAYPDFANATATGWQQLQAQPDRYIAPFLRSTDHLLQEHDYEYKQRVERYQMLRARMQAGEVQSINDLTSENLDIQRFVCDLLQDTQDFSFLACFYEQLMQLTILDPTCGSGEFLIASIQILRPLYAICLQRLHAQPQQHPDTLSHACTEHLSQPASILSTILTHNLYGVDLQQDAVELCILRLYLLLLGEIRDISMVPTLDTLSIHVHTANALAPLTKQTHSTDTAAFSWTATFPEIFVAGGFAVIIGNPPYIECGKSTQEDMFAGREQKNYGNIYAAIIERSLQLAHGEQSMLGLIVPISICSSARFTALRQTLLSTTQSLWLANFEIFPCRLFDGAYQRLSILIAWRQETTRAQQERQHLHVTRIHRWYTPERAHLFHLLTYTAVTNQLIHLHNPLPHMAIPKLASTHHERLMQRLSHQTHNQHLAQLLHNQPTEHFVYYQEATNYWTKAVCHIPYYKKDGVVMRPPHGRILFFANSRLAYLIMAVINSSLFYLWFATYSDGFHLSHTLVKHFPLPNNLLQSDELYALARHLEQDMRKNARLSTRNTHDNSQTALSAINHRIEITEYSMRSSKHILDEIDHLLAGLYGFSPEEEKFIAYYDRKHRLFRNHRINEQVTS